MASVRNISGEERMVALLAVAEPEQRDAQGKLVRAAAHMLTGDRLVGDGESFEVPDDVAGAYDQRGVFEVLPSRGRRAGQEG